MPLLAERNGSGGGARSSTTKTAPKVGFRVYFQSSSLVGTFALQIFYMIDHRSVTSHVTLLTTKTKTGSTDVTANIAGITKSKMMSMKQLVR